MCLSLFLKILLVLSPFILLAASAQESLKNCYNTAECPDSGTVCKLAAPGAPQDSDDPDDYTVSVDESSASLANHPTADAQFPEIIPPNARSAGISSSKFILDDASDDQIQVSLDSEAKEIGSVISAHGYRCQITDIHASKQAETSNADNLVSDDAVDSLNDVQVPAKGHPFKLNLGKIIRLGSITCKILGKIQESLPISPTAVTRRTAATVRGIQRNLRIKVTPKPTGKAMGRCICDKARRFACETHADCFDRFQSKDVQCHNSSGCPSDLGYPGYCRLQPSPVIVLNDESH